MTVEPGPAQPDVGVAVTVSPLVRRVLAPNPSMLTGRGTNTYVIGGGPPFTVLDPGPASAAHLGAILAAAPVVGAIVVTHTHADHSPGAAVLAAATGAEVAGFGPCVSRSAGPLGPSVSRSAGPLGPRPRAGIEGHDDTFAPDRTLVDGDVVHSGDHRLVALHTPGHASNHLCFLLEGAGERVLFTGDHVMEGSTVVIAPLDGDMADYLAQLERIRDLGVDRLLPGHGDPIPDPAAYVQSYLDHRSARTTRILAVLAGAGEAGATTAELVESSYADVPKALHPVALYSTWATLRASNHATSDTPDTLASRWHHQP